MATRICLVWEQIPEKTDLYVLELTEPELKRVRACAGLFVNCDPCEGDLAWLMRQIDGEDGYGGPWKKHKHGVNQPLTGPFEEVIVSGWYL